MLVLLCLCGPRAAAGAELSIYEAATARIQESYLDLDDIDATDAFIDAAKAAEQAVPWLLVDERFDTRGGQVDIILSHGDSGAFATVAMASPATLEDLPPALAALEDAIEQRAERIGPQGLPADLDLPVELLRGMSRALDRHSSILAGDRLDAFNERIRGHLVGIGCTVAAEGGDLVVRDLFPEGPAALGGLRVGDAIERIDGISTVGMLQDDLSERIRGEKGTSVDLVVQRPDPETGRPVDVRLSLVRDDVRIPNVDWRRTAAGVGYLHIDHFSQQTSRLLETALAELAAPPAVSGLILDLRGNSGGSMLQAARTVDLFVDEGLILRTGGRGFEKVHGLVREVQAWPPDPDAQLPPLATQAPLVVLIDSGSASASEIVAGALSLLGRAVLVGQPSHGKGTVQQPFVLREASAGLGEVKLKLTIAEYHLAEDTPVLEGIGLSPDLRTDPVTLGRAGASLPMDVVDGQALGFVLEGAGWRQGPPPPDRGDVEVALAERIARAAHGPSRAEALSAAASLAVEARRVEDRALVRAMDAHGIDWSGDDLCHTPCAAPRIAVHVDLDGPALAGQPVQLRARVDNLGAAPLYRVLVRLGATPGLPWSGLSIPVGFIPPGEQARGQQVLELPMSEGTRDDLVAVMVQTDRRPLVAADAVLLSLEGTEPPAISAQVHGLSGPAALSADGGPAGPGELQVEVKVGNRSAGTLTGVQVRFHVPADPRLEPVDRGEVIESLSPGATAAVRLGFHWSGDHPPVGPLEVPLEIEAERYGTLLQVAAPVPWSGASASLVPPGITGEVPRAAAVGDLPVRLVASDDQGVESVTAWWRGEKVAWRSGAGGPLVLNLDLSVGDGTNSLVAEVTDLEGITVCRRWYVRGGAAGDAAASP